MNEHLMRVQSQNLRRNATEEEKRLWYGFLRDYPVQFRRQKVFGPYIVDFYCGKAKLVIELDGIQHREQNAVEYDQERDKYLSQGRNLTVLRICNWELRNHFGEVCKKIHDAVQKASYSKGERKKSAEQ